jgi:hypothetical protein
MAALALIGSLISLVCLILTLIKMYPIEGLGKTLLGLICGIFAFIWGWQNVGKLAGHKNVMIAWTAGIALGLIGNIGASL